MNWCLETYRNCFVLRSDGRSLREGDWIIYIVFLSMPTLLQIVFCFLSLFLFLFFVLFFGKLENTTRCLSIWITLEIWSLTIFLKIPDDLLLMLWSSQHCKGFCAFSCSLCLELDNLFKWEGDLAFDAHKIEYNHLLVLQQYVWTL